MKTHKQKIIRRINLLYIFFFSIVLGYCIYEVSSHEFQAGFKEGLLAGKNSCKEPLFKTYTVFDVPLKREAGVYNTLIREDDNLQLNARVTNIDLKIEGEKVFRENLLGSFLWRILSFFCYIAIFIIVIIMLILLRTSLRTGNIFDRLHISFVRSIGILLIIGSFLNDLARYLEIHRVSELLQGTLWQTSLNVFSFRDILIGVLILVIAEIFAIGYDISEDQKLTI